MRDKPGHDGKKYDTATNLAVQTFRKHPSSRYDLNPATGRENSVPASEIGINERKMVDRMKGQGLPVHQEMSEASVG